MPGKSCASLLLQRCNQPAQVVPVAPRGSAVCPGEAVWRFHPCRSGESADHTDECRLPARLPYARQTRRWPRGECTSTASTRVSVRFFKHLSYRLVAHALHILQFYHTIGEESERPSGLSDRRRAARKGDEMSFLCSIQGSCSRLRMVTVVESIIQPVGHKALAYADHGVAAHLEGLGDLFIGPPRTRSILIDFQ